MKYLKNRPISGEGTDLILSAPLDPFQIAFATPVFM